MRIFAVTETDAHLRLLASRGLVDDQRRPGADVDPQPSAERPRRAGARVRAAPPRLGGTRLVCVDGPAGSGKTTFAGRLAAALGPDAAVVHLDDLYAGWTLTGAVARLAAGVLRPVADGRPGAFDRYDWTAGRFDRPDPGAGDRCWSSRAAAAARGRWTRGRRCGSGSRRPPALRTRAAGWPATARPWPEWRALAAQEAAEFAREDTRARADLRVDGGAPSTE